MRRFWVAVLLVIVVGSGLGVGAGMLLARWMPVIPHISLKRAFTGPFGNQRYVRILMIGEDDTSKCNKTGFGLSDTIVVLAIDTQTKEMRAISIPRDTRTDIPGRGVGKINSANVFGGPQLVAQTVSNLLAVPIDYYIETNTHGLRGMVDEVGGVYIVVDKDMNYDDRHGNLHIHLKASPEKQLLNGRQAEGFVRFRHDRSGDYGYRMVDGKRVPTGRVVRQQIFMRALANRILAMPSKADRARFLRTAFERNYLATNLSICDFDDLSDYIKDFRPEKMMMDVMPGSLENIDGVSYVVPDYDALKLVVERNLLFKNL